MSNTRTAYDTLACQGFVLTKLKDALQRAVINGQFSRPQTDDYGRVLVIDALDESALIPAFVHPISLVTDIDENKNHIHAKHEMVVDCRPYVRYDARSGEMIIKNIPDYRGAVLYGNLASAWVEGERLRMRDIGVQATTVYASWISENVARRFALTPREQLDLAILSAIFYQGLFSEGDHMTEREYNGLVATVARAARVQATEVFEFVDRMNLKLPIGGISDFCALAYEVTGSIRLKEFSAGLLFEVVGGSWWGPTARELTAVALEYPPAFLTMLVIALTEKSYNKVGIARIAERMNQQESKVLIASLGRILERDE